MADIEATALNEAAKKLSATGPEFVISCVDVSDPHAVKELAALAFESFGCVNIVCNNAGVIENNLAIWEYSLSYWHWVLGINVMGVVHGMRVFVPRMIASGEPGHIVNTA